MNARNGSDSTNRVEGRGIWGRAARSLAIVTLGALPFLPFARAGDDTATAPSASGRFSALDLFQLEWVDGPQFSPDGSRIVFERRSGDVLKDRFRCDLWLINVDGSGLEALTTDGASGGALWMQDGKSILHRSVFDGRVQLARRFLDSNRTSKLTNVADGPGEVALSMDGRFLAFTMFVPKDSAPLAKMPTPPSGASWGPNAREIDDVSYRADGAGYLSDGFMQIFVLPIEGGTPRQVTDEACSHSGPLSWTNDGKAIVFSANRRPDADYMVNDSEICEVDVESGKVRELTDREGPDNSPVLSPDGSRIAYLGFDDKFQGYQVTHLYSLDRASGRSRCLTPDFDRDILNPTWSNDGRRVYFQYAEEGNTKIGSIAIDGDPNDVRFEVGDVGGTSWSRPYSGGSFALAANGSLAFTQTRPDHPADLAVVTDASRGAQRITRFNDDVFAGKELASCETIWFPSKFDQRSIQGWIMKPPGFDPSKKYPLILEIHGGPFADYGDRFAAEFQMFAAAGYVVLYTNPRGSTSYGETFGNLIHHDYPNHDYEDLMSGVDAVIAKGYVDESNLFVTGGSGGGLLTAWIVGHTDRFRAAVSAKPVINWYSFVLTSDSSSHFIRYWFPGPPWEHAEHYMKRSPITYVGNVKTPTMLLTGDVDYRTPLSESEQFYQALKQRKIDTMLVQIPDASHGMDGRPTQLASKVEHILGWFEKYRTAK